MYELSIILISYASYTFIRNICVFRARCRIINKISELNKKDIEAGNYNYDWRWARFEEKGGRDGLRFLKEVFIYLWVSPSRIWNENDYVNI